jgi:hypothetical protein
VTLPPVRAFLLSLSLLVALTATAFAAPTDIVPRGHIAYDLLGSLAAAGRLPGYALRDFLRGDRLYTRGEMARILALRRKETAAEDPYAAAERALVMEFATELKALGEAVPNNSALPARTGIYTAQGKLRLFNDPAAGALTARFSAALPVGRDGVAALSFGDWRREWYDRPNAYPAIETAYLRVNGRVLDVTVGVSPLRWGPGFVGGLSFSDDAPSVPRIEVSKDFRLWGTLGRRIGPLKFTQFLGEFYETNDPTAEPNARGTRRHLAGRRLETAGTGRWNLSFAEMFKSTRLPDPVFSAVLPFYLYQHDWTAGNRNLLGFLVSDEQPNTAWMNYMGDIGVSYRADARGTVLYADLLLDDVQAPFGWGKGDDVPRKIGQQYGVYFPDLGGASRYGLRLEYTNTDPTTYTNISGPIAWTNDALPLAHPAGPNAHSFFVRFDARVNDRVNLAAEGEARRRGSDIRGPATPDADRFGLFGTYLLRRDAFIGFRYDYRRVSPPGSPSDTRSRFEVNAGFGF